MMEWNTIVDELDPLLGMISAGKGHIWGMTFADGLFPNCVVIVLNSEDNLRVGLRFCPNP
jgi:hypothetical protein